MSVNDLRELSVQELENKIIGHQRYFLDLSYYLDGLLETFGVDLLD